MGSKKNNVPTRTRFSDIATFWGISEPHTDKHSSKQVNKFLMAAQTDSAGMWILSILQAVYRSVHTLN